MVILLLSIIYISFISLGLPDSLLGAAWPVMYSELGVPISYAGIISFIITLGTIISSLFSERLSRILGTGIITALSCLVTALSLFGFALSESFVLICILALPYGLGAGAVDAALNNYVALHFASKHMSWLHCFWGVGACIGPYVMSIAVSIDKGWREAYGILFFVQLSLSLLIFLSLPVWRKAKGGAVTAVSVPEKIGEPSERFGITSAVRTRGVPSVLIMFFCYCAYETTAGLWISTYLAEHSGLSESLAASLASFYYIGITLGRFISGFIADRMGDEKLTRVGGYVMLFGAAIALLSPFSHVFLVVGAIVAGVGGAPIYPSIIHLTPKVFGEGRSQSIVGVEMASAYLGSALMPPLFGLVSEAVGISFLPYFLMLFTFIMVLFSEVFFKYINKKSI